jgi:hypothetical protein
LHVKVHPVATAVVAAVNLTQHAPASIAWLAVAVVAHADTVVAAAAFLAVAVAVAGAVDAEAVVVEVMAAAMAVAMVGAAPSVANWFSSTISPAMIGNGPIIELHFGTAKLAVLGGSATHSGAPHFERT